VDWVMHAELVAMVTIGRPDVPEAAPRLRRAPVDLIRHGDVGVLCVTAGGAAGLARCRRLVVSA